MVDEKVFFHEATMRICSELDAHKALENTMEYISEFIPMTELIFGIYSPESVSVRALAYASKDDLKTWENVFVIPKRFHKQMAHDWKYLYGADISNFDDDDELGEWFDNQLGLKRRSRIVLPLDLTGTRLGVVEVCHSDFIYTPEHGRLLELLHQPFAIALSNALRYEEVLHLKDVLSDDNRFLQSELRDISGEEIIGADFGLRSVMELMRQVAPLTSPVLVLGESGVGKEVVANGIHSFSERKEGPFIKVNCGAIPDSLIDSELFGHEKGAFTGAVEQKRGRFERADKGTIFLDEIGELSPQAQVRLLRVLQNKEFERVGGSQTIPVDVRVIAATNRDLQGMVDRGEFREDLWFRINVFPILVPPLRSRLMDIPALVQHFVERKAKEFKIHPMPQVSKDVFELMMEYSWPGNVRELENVLERAIIRGKSGPLEREHFFLPLQGDYGEVALPVNKGKKAFASLDVVTRNYIKEVLQSTGWKIHGRGGAAEVLGMNPNTLRSRMRKLKIPFKK